MRAQSVIGQYNVNLSAMGFASAGIRVARAEAQWLELLTRAARLSEVLCRL